MTLFCGQALANDVTINAADMQGAATEATEVNGITFFAEKNNGSTAPTFNTNGQDFRIYAKGTLKISATTSITKVVFNISTQGLRRLAPITASVGTIAEQAAGDQTVTWTGSAKEIVLTVGDKANYGSDGDSKAGQLDFASVVVTIDNGAPTEAAKPTISPNGGSFDESIEVTLKHSNPDAEIYYSINKADFQHYTAPFTLTETSTVTAYAIDEECDVKQSGEVEATFTKNAPVQVQTITVAEFNAAAESTEVWYQLTGTVKNLKDGDKYGNFDLEDETGSVYVYGLLSEKGGQKQQFQALATEKGIKNGSKLTLIGNRGSYTNKNTGETKIEVLNAYFVSVDNSGVGPDEPTPEVEQINVAKALEIAGALEAGATTTAEYEVKGYIVGAPDFQRKDDGSLYGNVNLTIADEKDGTALLTVYRGKNIGNVNFTEETITLKEGDLVTFHGKLQKYVKDDVTTLELVSGYLVSNTPTAISAAKQQGEDGAVYNLRGQRVAQPVKGVYVVSGRKVVVK